MANSIAISTLTSKTTSDSIFDGDGAAVAQPLSSEPVEESATEPTKNQAAPATKKTNSEK